MKQLVATSKEQSLRLLACGIDSATADMYWCEFVPKEPFLCLGEIPRDNETGEPMDYGDMPAWSLATLMSLIPQIILYPDPSDAPIDYDIDDDSFVPPLKEWQWMMYRNRESRFMDEEGECVVPAQYGMTYETIRVLPADHPFKPNSAERISLFGDDGNYLIWSDESPIEVCVQALEWLASKNLIPLTDKANDNEFRIH